MINGLVMARTEIATFLEQYKWMKKQLDERIEQLIDLVNQLPDYEYLSSVPSTRYYFY